MRVSTDHAADRRQAAPLPGGGRRPGGGRGRGRQPRRGGVLCSARRGQAAAADHPDRRGAAAARRRGVRRQVPGPSRSAWSCSATPPPPGTACTARARRPARCSPPACSRRLRRPVRLHRLAVVGAISAGLAPQVEAALEQRPRPGGDPDRRQRRHQHAAAGHRRAPPRRRGTRAARRPAPRWSSAPAPTWARSSRSSRRCAGWPAGGAASSPPRRRSPWWRRAAGRSPWATCSARGSPPSRHRMFGLGPLPPLRRGLRAWPPPRILPTVLAALGAGRATRPRSAAGEGVRSLPRGRAEAARTRRHGGQRRPGRRPRPRPGGPVGAAAPARCVGVGRCRPADAQPDDAGTAASRPESDGSRRERTEQRASARWSERHAARGQATATYADDGGARAALAARAAAADHAVRRHGRRRRAARRRGASWPAPAGTPSRSWAWRCAPRSAAPGAPPLRLVLLGDSSALGVGVDRVGGHRRRPARRAARRAAAGPASARCALSSVGVSGSRSTDLATQVARALLGERPDVAVILIGANDATALRRPGRGGRPPRRGGAPAARGRGRGRRRHLPRPRRGTRDRPAAAPGRRLARPPGGPAPRRARCSTAGGTVVDLAAETGPVFRADAGHALPRRLPPVRRRLPGLGARPAAGGRRRGAPRPRPLTAAQARSGAPA